MLIDQVELELATLQLARLHDVLQEHRHQQKYLAVCLHLQSLLAQHQERTEVLRRLAPLAFPLPHHTPQTSRGINGLDHLLRHQVQLLDLKISGQILEEAPLEVELNEGFVGGGDGNAVFLVLFELRTGGAF